MKPPGITWRRYLRTGLGMRLSRIGERLGIRWLTYNPLVFWVFHDWAVADAPAVMDAFAECFPLAQSYADIGAGSGAYAAEALRRGKRVVACEHSAVGRRLGRKQGVDTRPFDLAVAPYGDLGGPFDLAFCFEVAEHLPPELGDRLVEFIAAQAPVVVFTAGQPGQGGIGHINEQPKGYWIERFERRGLRFDPGETQRVSETFARCGVSGPWLIKNVMVFREPGE